MAAAPVFAAENDFTEARFFLGPGNCPFLDAHSLIAYTVLFTPKKINIDPNQGAISRDFVVISSYYLGSTPISSHFVYCLYFPFYG